MADTAPVRRMNVELARLRPTQLTVGMREVKYKRKRLRALEKRPGELVAFILEMPIRAVLGPGQRVYVIDHHHLALALLKEDFQTAPMELTADFSRLPMRTFWRRMQARQFVHLYDAKGRPQPLSALRKDLRHLQDDPYRSLAGFVRAAGGFSKTPSPFAEFQWADYFRQRIGQDWLEDHFRKAVAKALRLARHLDAARLPGYVGRKTKGCDGQMRT